MNYAPIFGMFERSAGPDLVDQIVWAHEQGFRAWEDNTLPYRSRRDQDRIAQALADRGMRMGVFVVGDDHGLHAPTISRPDADAQAAFLLQIEDRVELARRMNATWMTVLPGVADLVLKEGYQLANIVETLRRAAEMLEPHGLVMAVEPVSGWSTPGDLIDAMDLGYLICKSVSSPSCKLLFDVFQQQVLAGNIIEEIDYCWDEICYFQIGDHPGRHEPGTGEINYPFVMRHIASKGYGGLIGMEHSVRTPTPAGEMALVHAYRRMDAFIGEAGHSTLLEW